jgi:hydroxyacylglutathione hydrolase
LQFVFCGHEYTVQNLKFALSVEPDNEYMQDKISWAKDQRAESTPTVPSTIGEEKRINPFMRCINPEIQKKMNTPDAISLMAKLREMKDNYKS